MLFLGGGAGGQARAWGVRAVLGSLPVTAGAPSSAWRGQGWGFPSLPRRVKGRGAGVQPAGQSKAPLSSLTSKREPCALRGSYLTPSSMGQGQDWDRGTGRAPWGAGTGSAAPRQEAAPETPKQLHSETGTGPRCWPG